MNVCARQVRFGVLPKALVLPSLLVVSLTITAANALLLDLEQAGALLPTHAIISPVLVPTTTTVRLVNVFVRLVILGASPNRLVLPFRLAAPQTTVADNALASFLVGVGALQQTLAIKFQLIAL